ncbi:mCG141899, partial [Mus musculus]
TEVELGCGQKLSLLKLSGNKGGGQCLGLWIGTWASVGPCEACGPLCFCLPLFLFFFLSFLLLLLLSSSLFEIDLLV